MKELIYQPEPRKAPLRCLPGGRLFGPSIDHQSTPCQVILSLSTEPVVLLEMKHAKRSFPKEASSGPVWVDRSGIAGGHSAKRPPNFGPDRVVYAYPALHYPKWRAEFPSLAVAFHAGAFGESFTLTGADEEAVCIGDIIRVGSCHLQLSEPRQPDQWLYWSRRIKIIEAAKRTNRIG
jgi:MOSC domain